MTGFFYIYTADKQKYLNHFLDTVKMKFIERSLGKFTKEIYSLMRIIIAVLFASHGAQKLFGILGAHAMHNPKFIVAGIIEFFGGIMIGLGFKTRIAAFIASGEMAVAYFMVHYSRGFWPIMNGGEKAVFYCFVFLFIASYGPGSWSIDSLLKRK
jgi:putative oxidoreductase